MPRAASLWLALTLLITCATATHAVYSQPTGYDGYQVVRIDIGNEAELQRLRGLLAIQPDFELWSEALGVGPMDVRVAPQALPLLDASDLRFEVVVPDLQEHIDQLYGGGRGGGFFDYLRTYDEHVQFMQDLAKAHPELAEMVNLGLSVQGRPLWALRITGSGQDKPAVMYNGAQHGNEQAGASVVAYAANHLLTSYGSDPDVTTLVDNVEWFLLPIMNPDGYVIFTRRNAHDVDLNRNWGGPGSGQDPTGGPYPFSEPETTAMRDFFLAHPNVRAYIDFHGYVAMLLWPWGHTPELCPDDWTYQAVTEPMAELIWAAGGGHYTIGPCNTTLYPVSGGSNDYTYGELGIWAFTFELRNALLPNSCEHFLPTTLFLSEWISDCNGNGVPDVDDIALGTSIDCTGNGIPDECERDCNENGVADNCDTLDGTSEDCTGNLIPDECEPDCNENGVADSCDILDGTSEDCNNNGIPDECMHLEDDCNENGVPDRCDIANGTSEDCNVNDIPDECDLADGTSEDCNDNGVPDQCDIYYGVSMDCQGNFIPDECEVADGTSEDCNVDGVPDECQVDGAGINMERTLLLLNLNHAQITSLIPDRFDFSEGETGDEIVDGGENMYDGGNRLTTDRAARLPYSDGLILPAETHFGPNSRYFTAKYPGLFVMVAWDTNVDWFAIRGDLGADGLGSVDETTLQTVYLDPQILFTVFVKRVYDAPTPSVNHILILPGDGADIVHLISDDTNQDRDRLSQLGGIPLLMYALVSRQDGGYLDDNTVLAIADELLSDLVLAWADCNGNGIPDDCDIADGLCRDFNGNGVPDACECLGDLTGDNQIDLADLAKLLEHYGQSDGPGFDNGDLDGDGDVDIADLAALLGSYGTTCE
jgi:carboxypeptidase A2